MLVNNGNDTASERFKRRVRGKNTRGEIRKERYTQRPRKIYFAPLRDFLRALWVKCF